MDESTHTFTVTVTGCTAAQAVTVMQERICFDEEYGFGYGITYEPATVAASTPSWTVPSDAEGRPLLDDATVRSLWEFSTSAADMQARINQAVANRTSNTTVSTTYGGGIP